MQNGNSLKRVMRPLEIFLIIAVCVIFIQVLAEVCSRYIFNFSIAWSQELAQTILVWIGFIGAAVAFVYSEHMAIEILLDRIETEGKKRFVLIIGQLCIALFLVIATWGGVQLVQRTWFMKTVTMQIPAGVMYMAFPVGCVIMLIAALRNLFGLLARKG